MGEVRLTRKEFTREDFSGQDLSKRDLSHSKFFGCNFDRANLSDANCSYSVFTGSSFRGTNCNATNFMMASLNYTDFHPRDGYGMTMTFRCQTFKGMRISRLWWYGYRFFSLMMEPELINGKDLRDADIATMGAELYAKLKIMFGRREM